jgi:hypothetical protein
VSGNGTPLVHASEPRIELLQYYRTYVRLPSPRNGAAGLSCGAESKFVAKSPSRATFSWNAVASNVWGKGLSPLTS